MRLMNDVTRCLGQGSAGHKCSKREQCRRYLEREAVNGERLRYAALLCRAKDYECRIPVKGEVAE